MKINTRFIKGLIDTAAKTDSPMPWARGTRRAAFIAKRADNIPLRKTA